MCSDIVLYLVIKYDLKYNEAYRLCNEVKKLVNKVQV